MFVPSLRKRLGARYVIAKRTERMLQRYGADTKFITLKQHNAAEKDYRRLYGDPYDPIRRDMLLALVAAKNLLTARACVDVRRLETFALITRAIKAEIDPLKENPTRPHVSDARTMVQNLKNHKTQEKAMTKIGYARVSSRSQNYEEQERLLREAGCALVRAEKQSGKSTAGRDELAAVLALARDGDEIVATKIDRVARSLRNLLEIVETLREKGASLTILWPPLSSKSGDPATNAFLAMLGTFAEFERAIILERQREGLEAARRAGGGRPPGRKPTLDREAFRAFLRDNPSIGATESARRMRISSASYYRLLNECASGDVIAPR